MPLRLAPVAEAPLTCCCRETTVGQCCGDSVHPGQVSSLGLMRMVCRGLSLGGPEWGRGRGLALGLDRPPPCPPEHLLTHLSPFSWGVSTRGPWRQYCGWVPFHRCWLRIPGVLW